MFFIKISENTEMFTAHLSNYTIFQALTVLLYQPISYCQALILPLTIDGIAVRIVIH